MSCISTSVLIQPIGLDQAGYMSVTMITIANNIGNRHILWLSMTEGSQLYVTLFVRGKNENKVASSAHDSVSGR